MKEYRRLLPKKNGGTREGMYRERVWQSNEPGSPAAKGPLEQLQDLVAACDSVLEETPGSDDYYSIACGAVTNHGPERPSKFHGVLIRGSLWQMPGHEENDRALGIEAHHYPIQRLSTEYFAWLARENAQAALAQIEAGNLMAAVDKAMAAVADFKNMQAVYTWEPDVARAGASAAGRRKGKRRTPWADALAEYLTKRFPDLSARATVECIPEGDPEDSNLILHPGLAIARSDGKVTAHLHDGYTQVGEISETTLRKNYLSRAKKQKKS